MPEKIEDIPGAGDITTDPNDAIESSKSLDALLSEASGETDEKAKAEAEAKAKAEAEAADKAKAEAEAAAAKEGAPADDAAAKAEAEAKAKAEAEAAAANKDEFDAIELPPHAKPKTVEQFTNVKTVARAKIAAVTTELEKAKAELETARTAIEDGKKNSFSAEEKAELEELRNFRRGIDVESDPEFKKFDVEIESNNELIYSKLTKAGFSKESIDKVKALGGPSGVDWEGLADKLPAEVKRLIDVKLVENETISDKKARAIETAKKNSAEFLKTRQVTAEKSVTARRDATEKQLQGHVAKLPFLKIQEIPANAKPEEKARIEAANKQAAEIQGDLKEALNDDSPEMRAVLITAYAKMIKLGEDAKAKDAAHAAEVSGLKKTLKEKEDFIAKIQKSGTPRLNSSAPSTPDSSHRKTDIDESSSSALDRLRSEVESAKA